MTARSAAASATSPVAGSALREAALSQGDDIKARHPQIFRPDIKTRAEAFGCAAAVIGLLIFGLVWLNISRATIWAGIGRLGDFAVLMFPPSFGTTAKLWQYLSGLAATLAIAFLGTLLAAILALPTGFLAARNVVANKFVHFAARRVNDTIRAVDTLIWALIWINVVGLGPFAGALAIMSSDMGAFGKLMSEAIEAADRRPVDGVLSAGGSRLHGVRFGLLPQVLPVLASQVLYFLESNTRSATIIGIVGAGGIGLQLSEQIRVLEWQQVSFLILMVLLTVAVLDWISQRLRGAIIGHRPW